MIVARFRGGVPLWLPAWLVAWLMARDERRAAAAALELLGAPRRVVCPSCGVPFTRHGAASSSHFYRTAEENDTCIVCREGLDPITLEPRRRRKGKP